MSTAEQTTDEWYDESEFELDGEGVSKSEVGGSAGWVNKNGKYHGECVKMDTEAPEGKAPFLAVDFTVACDVSGQSPSGARHRERYYLSKKDGSGMTEGMKKRLFSLAIALGVAKEVTKTIENEEVACIVDTDTGKNVNIATLKRGLENHAIFEIRFEESDDPQYKGRYVIPFQNIWYPLDSAVSDVPKDLEALQLAGYEVGEVEAPDAMDDPDL